VSGPERVTPFESLVPPDRPGVEPVEPQRPAQRQWGWPTRDQVLTGFCWAAAAAVVAFVVWGAITADPAMWDDDEADMQLDAEMDAELAEEFDEEPADEPAAPQAAS
jgi:hypothetical protein